MVFMAWSGKGVEAKVDHLLPLSSSQANRSAKAITRMAKMMLASFMVVRGRG
jgi:hypothetical protein